MPHLEQVHRAGPTSHFSLSGKAGVAGKEGLKRPVLDQQDQGIFIDILPPSFPGRVGVQDLTRRLSRFDRRAEAPEAEPRPTLTRRELRRFRKMLDADAQRRRRDVDATS